jgi:hypothetical protein
MIKIKTFFTYEILGRPPEHLKETLELFIEKLEQKGVRVESKKIHEVKPVENKNAKDLFTTFAEVELSIDSLIILFSVIHNTLPSHIEILEPMDFNLKNFELNEIVNELTLKLHKYDEITKNLALEKNILLNKLKEIQAKKPLYQMNLTENLNKTNNQNKNSKKKKKKS